MHTVNLSDMIGIALIIVAAVVVGYQAVAHEVRRRRNVATWARAAENIGMASSSGAAATTPAHPKKVAYVSNSGRRLVATLLEVLPDSTVVLRRAGHPHGPAFVRPATAICPR